MLTCGTFVATSVSKSLKIGNLRTCWPFGGFRITFGETSVFKSLKNGNLRICWPFLASLKLLERLYFTRVWKLEIWGPVDLLGGFRGTSGVISLFKSLEIGNQRTCWPFGGFRGKILKIGNLRTCWPFGGNPWNFWGDYTFQESEKWKSERLKNARVSVSIPWSFWKVIRCRGTFGKWLNAVECPDRRGTFGECWKVKPWKCWKCWKGGIHWIGAKEWKVPDSRILR